MVNWPDTPTQAGPDAHQTNLTRARYNRIAPIYDLMETLPERHMAGWRKRLWAMVPGGRILEVGVGTGKNFAYHSIYANITGIDLSERMLDRARRRAEKLGRPVELRQMDVQQLDSCKIHIGSQTISKGTANKNKGYKFSTFKSC